MKKQLLTIAMFAGILTSTAQNNAETMKKLVSGIPALESQSFSNGDAIGQFNGIAAKSAAKVMELTKDNIAEVIKTAAGYKACIITVGNHTIVKIGDFKNCRTSGSWGACMPYGEGYIQNNGLTSMNDYINNIIGRPDSQVRIVYFFN